MNLISEQQANAYPTYKPSGIKWLGDVPAHWDLLPGRTCYSFGREPNTGMKEHTVLSLSYGKLRIRHPDELHGLVPASFETYQVIQPGDIVCRPTDLQNDWNSLRFGLSTHKGIITSAYIRLRPTDSLAKEYGHALLHTYDLMKIFYGLGSGLRQNLRWEDFKLLPCLVPPPPEQRAIVRFLNRTDERIQRFVSAKERLIALLEEEKQAIINRAVTRGLDPNVQLKASGVEWLGDVPAHWEARRLKTLCRIRYGLGQPPRELAEGLPLIRATNIERGRIVEEGLVRVDPSDVPVGRDALLKAQEIIVVRSGAYTADSAIIPADYEGAVTGYDMVMSVTGALPEFIAFGLLASYLRNDQLIIASMRAAQPHLNAEELGTSLVLVPPPDEQATIVRYLDDKTVVINGQIENVRRQIELVEEYRARLIADAVTGKIDVRETAGLATGADKSAS